MLLKANLQGWLPAIYLLVACGSAAGVAAQGHHADMSLVPPPPPSTPSLEIPPAPIELPYSYALNATGFVPEQLPLPKVTAVLPPRPAAPFKDPTPSVVRAANAPNLNTAYAQVCGFGTPRVTYTSPSGTTTPANESGATWFDASLRWYAQRVGSQQFFNSLQTRESADAAGAIQPATLMAAIAPAPYAVPHAAHHAHGGHKIGRHFRHARKVIVTR